MPSTRWIEATGALRSIGRWSPVAAAALASALACANTDTVTCADGRRCPDGWTCAANGDTCINDTCGNGVVDVSEGCDDGGVVDGDGCSSACEPELYPLVQNVSERAATVVWAAYDDDPKSIIEWGAGETLDAQQPGERVAARGGVQIFRAELTGLEADTAYRYQVESGAARVGPFRFTTPPADRDADIRVVALGAPRGDGEVLTEVQSAIVAQLAGEDGEATAFDELTTLMLSTGDLVLPMSLDPAWHRDFFIPALPLMAYVPLFPVRGGQDDESPGLYDYFAAPDNGDPTAPGRWWFIDRGAARIIGLDSTAQLRRADQLAWLDDRLAEAAFDPDIDFVLVTTYATYLGQREPTGDAVFTRGVLTRLEAFSRDTELALGAAKPTVLVTGSEAGYVRGQSPQQRTLLVDVSAAGGVPGFSDADRDPALVAIEHPGWGFAVFDVVGGLDPALRVTRVHRSALMPGAPFAPLETLSIRRFSVPPATPVSMSPQAPISPECAELQGSPFEDPDPDDTHLASQFQVSTRCDGAQPFEAGIVFNRLRHALPSSSGGAPPSLDRQQLPALLLEPDRPDLYCWRVRYRDSSLIWSAWSAPAPLSTGARIAADNQLINPGAEVPLDAEPAPWTAIAGTLARYAAGECGGPEPAEGAHLFAAGGLGGPSCDGSAAFAAALQRVDLSADAVAIDASGARVAFSGRAATFGGGDRPSIQVVLYGANGAQTATSQSLESRADDWATLADDVLVPPGTRTAELVLLGILDSLDGRNDSYFDALDLRLIPSGACASPAR